MGQERSSSPPRVREQSFFEIGEVPLELRNPLERGGLAGAGNLGRPMEFGDPETRYVGLDPEIHGPGAKLAKVVRLRLEKTEQSVEHAGILHLAGRHVRAIPGELR